MQKNCHGTEVINWLNTRDECMALVIADVAASHESSPITYKPLLMYSDELEAPRPPADLADRIMAEQSWCDDFARRVTPPNAIPPSPDRDLGEEESVLKTMK